MQNPIELLSFIYLINKFCAYFILEQKDDKTQKFSSSKISLNYN